MVKEHFLDLSW